MLRDPTDENVVPVVEELQRRLPKVSSLRQQQGDGQEYVSSQHDTEAAEEDGRLDKSEPWLNNKLSWCIRSL